MKYTFLEFNREELAFLSADNLFDELNTRATNIQMSLVDYRKEVIEVYNKISSEKSSYIHTELQKYLYFFSNLYSLSFAGGFQFY